MDPCTSPRTFCVLHIDAARNSTDDFNPFHDSRRWHRIAGNPFGGPIALGFQLAQWLEDRVRLHRRETGEEEIVRGEELSFSHYRFHFARPVYPGSPVEGEVRKGRLTRSSEGVSFTNRFMLRQDGHGVLTGQKRDADRPLVRLPALPPFDCRGSGDRCFLEPGGWFLKRKFLNTSDAKNFLLGSLVDQADYIDEIEERVSFPEIFPVAYVSCALLERAQALGHDFMTDPMVYATLDICVDSGLNVELRSNDMLCLLVARLREGGDEGRSGAEVYACHGLLEDGRRLFGVRVQLVPLSAIRDQS